MQTIKFKLNSEIKLPRKVIKEAPGQGKFDDYADYLLDTYNVEVTLQESIAYLKTYGAWDDSELSDLDDNKRRLLWLACLDCQDNDTNYFYMGD